MECRNLRQPARAVSSSRAEEWRAVPGYEGMYEVSSRGRVRSLDRFDGIGRRRKGRMMRVINPDDRYLRVALSRDGYAVHYYVHQLVAAAFHGLRPDGMEVNHKDGVKTNNEASNLEYVTRLGNVRHSIAKGLLVNKGTDNAGAKLNATDVHAVRVLYNEGFSALYIAALFGVSENVIRKAGAGESYTNVSVHHSVAHRRDGILSPSGVSAHVGAGGPRPRASEVL